MNRTNSKKVLASTLALAILVTGTFAWQSFSQEVTNEIIESVDTPGGRLHDYFNGSDKDVFVENYASGDNAPDVYARIRIREYFEFGKNAGTSDATSPTIVAGDISSGSTTVLGNTDTWDIYDYKATTDSDIREYRDLVLGGTTVYLPTFNDDNEDKTPEVNGTYRDSITGEVRDTPYEDYVEFTIDKHYDIDKDEVSTSSDATRTAKATETADVMTMSEWLTAGAPAGDTWVFDTDGWAYYAAPIAPGTASGLLIDGITIDSNPSEEWYYAVDVEAQLATAGDWGKVEDTDVTSSMYASTMSEDGLYVLNKAAGLVTVENMTITNNGAALSSTDAILSTTAITFDVDMDVINGMSQGNETDVTWTIAKAGDLTDTTTYASTLVASTTDTTAEFTATEAMATGVFSYVITATSDLDPNKSVSITMNPEALINISGLSASGTITGTAFSDINSATVLDDSSTVTIDGVEWYVLAKETKTNAEGESFNGAFLYMKEPLKVDGEYAAIQFQDVAEDGYDITSWKMSDLRGTLAGKLADYPTLAAAAQSVDTTVNGYTSGTAETTYDKFFPLSEAEFTGYTLSATDIAKDTADAVGGNSSRWLRSAATSTTVRGADCSHGTLGNNSASNARGVRPAIWVAL